ncbi:MAG: glycosyltransferase family 2 protein [Candidatus Helarchaeota archaeon]
MEYTAIIVTYNQREALKRAIDSVLMQTINPNEFIVIDNGSTDGTIELLLAYKKKNPIFRIFKSKANLGLCRAINIAVRMAKNAIILNMDHDSEFEIKNWVELAFPKLKKNKIALVWGTSNKGNKPAFKYSTFIGSAILFKKKIYLDVGGFPEGFFIYDNELDLTVRLFIAGYYPYFYEEIDVKHGLPSTEKFTPGNKGKMYIYYDLSNRLFIYWKYYPRFFATLLSIFHFIEVLRVYTKFFGEYLEPFRGLRRFFSLYYMNSYRERKTLSLKQFTKICYQQKYPALIYYVLKKIYG